MAPNANNGGSDGVVRIKPPPAPKANTTGPQNSEYSVGAPSGRARSFVVIIGRWRAALG